jgi:DNA-binding Lrp family transcriptional regulator
VFISPAQAGTIAHRARQLLQNGDLTHHQYALLDALLWRCRKQGSALASASYAALARLTHMAKDTIRLGLRKLEELGLIQRIKHRVRVRWLGCSVASRQGVNAYRLQPPETKPASTDTDCRPTIREIVIQTEAQEVKEARNAQAALAQVRAMMEQRLMGAG